MPLETKYPASSIRLQRNSRRLFSGIDLMKKLLTIAVLSVVVSGAVCSARAQEKSEAAEQHEPSPFQVVSKWANFLILFGGLAFLLKKPMGEFFSTRQNNTTTG